MISLFKYTIVTGILLIIVACAPKYPDKDNTQANRFELVMKDYYKRNKAYIKKYKMFYLEDKSIPGKDYYLYNVFPVDNDYIYIADTNYKYANLPSGYIEYNDRIFFLHEDIVKEPDMKLLKYLDSLHLLDSTRVKLQLGLLDPENASLIFDKMDETIRAVDYVLCKDCPLTIKERVSGSTYHKPDAEIFDVCK